MADSSDIPRLLEINRSLSLRSLPRRGSVAFKVAGKIPGGYLITLAGKKITVRSKLSLPIGQILRATVQDGGKTIKLRLLDPQTVDTRSPDSGSFSVGVGGELVQGLIQAKAPIDPRLIRAILSRSGGREELKRQLSRVMGHLYRKGMEPAGGGWDEALPLLLGSGADSSSRRDMGGEAREEEEQEESSCVLVDTVEETWFADSSPNPFSLFNHVSTPEGHSILLPINSSLGGRRLTGHLLLCFATDGTLERGDMEINCSKGVWTFSITGELPGGRGVLGVTPPSGSILNNVELLKELGKKVENFEVVLSENVYRDSVAGGDPPRHVDYTV